VLGLHGVNEENLNFVTTYIRKADIDTAENRNAIGLKVIIGGVYTYTNGELKLIQCSYLQF
jgi:hypothetical protein